jgi:L-serine dehydratase
VAILRALDAAMMAEHNGYHKKSHNSFDAVVRKMNYTGQKIVMDLRESIGSD